MFRIEGGTTSTYCDGVNRRSFLQLGVAGMASIGLADVLRAKELSVAKGKPRKDTAVLLIWLDGGPSHLDLYDLKPDAPAEYRGLWKPIATNVPGMEISELLPEQAKVADKFSIVRSLHHNSGDHFTGAHFMLTSRDGASGGDVPGKYPSIGSIATKVCGARRPGMPAYAALPYAMSVGQRPGYFGGNYLGLQHNPFETGGDPNASNFQVQNIQLVQNLTIARLEDRQSLLAKFDRMRRDVDNSGAIEAMDRFEREAYELVAGPSARKAFDIGSESRATRERYGRNDWGQSALLARRLVEAGSTFVTVHMGGWDTHWNLNRRMPEQSAKLDKAVAGLFGDLAERGLLDKVLVVICGEFGRTPRINDGGNGGPPLSRGTPGRDHWGNAMFCVLGGGGVKGGQVVGSTNRLGEVPRDRPLEPCDIHATIYHVLGVDPTQSFINHAGRPIPALDRGEVIRELV